jgi:signal peptidase I
MTAVRRRALVAAAVTAVAVLAARRLLLVINVIGDSMVPTFHHGDRVLAARTGTWRLRRGDVVIGRIAAELTYVTDPDTGRVRIDPAPADGENAGVSYDPLLAFDVEPDGHVLIVKRVGGVPGDVRSAGAGGAGAATVPAGHYVLTGDGPGSRDSAQWGPVPAAAIIGRVLLRLPTPASDR